MAINVTILTPTYNRKHTLPRLYDSLKKQTNYNFEWIIIDDGSTDRTDELVSEWLDEKNKFKIIFIQKENGGKHTAINRGIDVANGKFTLIVDSDDYLTEDAIEKVINKAKEIEYNKDFAGIAFNKGYSKNELVGTTFKGEFVDATSLERKRYNINGDKEEVFYTEILKNNKFPEFEGEKFVTEALVWNRIASQGYKLRWFQDIIYICEYREDGLTKKGKSIFKDSPNGLKLYINECIQNYHLNIFMRLLKYEYYSNCIYDNNDIEAAARDLGVKTILIKLGIILRKIVNIVRN